MSGSRLLSAIALVALFVPAAPPASLEAQTSDSAPRVAVVVAAEAVKEAVARQLGALAADSMRERATPSHGLDAAARYMAAEFARLGLQLPPPQLNAKSWVQQYPLPGQLPIDSSSFVAVMTQVTRRGKAVVDESHGAVPLVQRAYLYFGGNAYFAPEVGPQTVARIPFNFVQFDPFDVAPLVTLVAGRQSVASVRRSAAALRDQVVLYVPAPEVDTALRGQLIRELDAVSQGVLIVSADDAAHFAAAAAQAAQQASVTRLDDYLGHATNLRTPWAVWVRGEAIQDFLPAELDLPHLQADITPRVQALASTVAMLFLRGEQDSTAVTAPNVVGWLEGSDSALKDEVIVLSAHLDNVLDTVRDTAALRAPRHRDRADRRGHPASPGDANLGDDNTAGVAVLLALAQAFGEPGARPRRSVLFLAPSGGAQPGVWGTNWFLNAQGENGWARHHVVLDLNLDQLDPTEGDSLVIDGVQEVALTSPPLAVAAAHPEVGLTVVGGETVLQPASDHFAFARATIPSLYVHTAATEATARKAVATDAAPLARIARLVFALVQEIGDASTPPRWNAAGYAHLRQVLEGAP